MSSYSPRGGHQQPQYRPNFYDDQPRSRSPHRRSPRYGKPREAVYGALVRAGADTVLKTQETVAHPLIEVEVKTDTMLVAAGVKAEVDQEKDLGAVVNQQRKSCSRMLLLM